MSYLSVTKSTTCKHIAFVLYIANTLQVIKQQMSSTLSVTKSTTLANTLSVHDATTLANTLQVTGATKCQVPCL